MPDLLELLLTHPFIQRAIISAILVSLISATTGTFMVFRGLSFMVSGVAHAALGGAALGIFLQSTGIAPWFDPILGALLFSLVIAIITGYAGETGVTSRMEVAVGVTFALSMSAAVFFMYYIPPERMPRVWGYLIGDPLLLTSNDLILLFTACFLLLIFTAIFFKEFTYVSLDMEGSMAHGMNVKFYHYLMLITSAIAISIATKAVGAILVYAIMVAPAAASNEWAKTVRSIILWVFIISLLSQLIGLAASLQWNTSPRAIAGIISTLVYIGALVTRRRRK